MVSTQMKTETLRRMGASVLFSHKDFDCAYIFSFSLGETSLFTIEAMVKIPIKLSARRVRAKPDPRAVISKRNIGILVVDHAPIKIRIFEYLTPFFINTAATGKAP